jgi:hypothetical protein
VCEAAIYVTASGTNATQPISVAVGFGGFRLHGKPSRIALSSDLSRNVCISNALDGSEDDILWKDDGEDKDVSDWVTDNNSVMSDDGESDE